MNVGRLRQMLESYEDSMPVHIAYNSGDHWRTILAPEVKVVESVAIEYSHYHGKFCLVKDGDDSQDQYVVVISANYG